MSVMLNDIQLLGEEGKEWSNRTGSKIATGMKYGCKYQIKLYRSAPYPDESMETPAMYERKIKACNELFSLRRDINELLKKADAGDRILGYAEEVFLNKQLPNNGVIEAVPFIEGGQDYTGHRTDEDWMEQAFLHAAEAVARLHDNGLLHTDIKPENMVFTCDDAKRVRCTLIDFDKSCYEGRVPEDVGGTPGFQSPELIDILIEEDPDRLPELTRRISYSSDVFALGASYLVMLTGKVPDITKDEGNHWQTDWDRGTVHVPYLSQMITAMLDPDPKKRPDAEAVVETLRTKTFVSSVQKCTLWEEHADLYQFNPKKEAEIRRITPEMFNGEKGYCVRFSEGSVRHYSLKLMTNSFILTARKNAPPARETAEIRRPVYTETSSADAGGLSPEDAKRYTVNARALRDRGWTLLHRPDGYYYRTADGQEISINISTLLFFRIISKKE